MIAGSFGPSDPPEKVIEVQKYGREPKPPPARSEDPPPARSEDPPSEKGQ